MELSTFEPNDIIYIDGKKAAVCRLLNCTAFKIVAEVVYINDMNQAVHQNAIFENNEWSFILFPPGKYAGHYERYKPFISLLRDPVLQ